jgi:hypothetical protein
MALEVALTYLFMLAQDFVALVQEYAVRGRFVFACAPITTEKFVSPLFGRRCCARRPTQALSASALRSVFFAPVPSFHRHSLLPLLCSKMK